jgi:hypothetical protein
MHSAFLCRIALVVVAVRVVVACKRMRERQTQIQRATERERAREKDVWRAREQNGAEIEIRSLKSALNLARPTPYAGGGRADLGAG